MMGRVMGSDEAPKQNPSIPADNEAKFDGYHIRRTHQSSPDCWCQPIEESPGVWVHRDPTLDGYVPDIKGAIQGDDGPS
jgi:hypothetical protein